MTASETWIKRADRIGECISPLCFRPVAFYYYYYFILIDLLRNTKNGCQNCFIQQTGLLEHSYSLSRM